MKGTLNWKTIYVLSAIVCCGPEVTAFDRTLIRAQACHIRDIQECASEAACVDQANTRGETLLMAVVAACPPSVVRLVIEKTSAIDARDIEGGTALIRAAGRGSLETVQLLIQSGADVNAESEYYQTPLSAAIESGSRSTVEYLLQHGACTGGFNFEGMSYAQMAATMNDAAMQALLMKYKEANTCRAR